MNAGHPALRLLARRKFVGFWRRQARKLRTPKGAFLALLGLAVFGLWFGSIAMQARLGRRGSVWGDAADFQFMVSVGLLSLTVLTIANALSFRGLYLQQNEIESLFSAPLSRPQLIRYRLLSSMARAAFGSAFFGWMVARQAPRPSFAFAGAFVALLTFQVLAQALSLIAGSAENRWAGRLAKLPLRKAGVVLAVALVFVVINASPDEIEELTPGEHAPGLVARIRGHAFADWAVLPVAPWARTITAEDHATFWPWMSVCLALLGGAWFFVPRIAVDFRELSLETSADVARRLARARRGLAAAGGPASARTRSWRTPWLAGRGPFGAAAWRKAVSIVRKAKSSFLIGALIVGGISVFALTATRSGQPGALAPAAIVAAAGTVYLCLGLRFDFREDLDLMPTLRSWPLAPWKLFLATLLPETLLVTAMIWLGVSGVSLYRRDFDARLLVIAGLVPFVVLAWTAIDNATFLFAPVRVGAGHDGALQNAGRGLVVFLARGLVLCLVFGFACTPFLLASFAFDLELTLAALLGVGLGLPILAFEIGVLIWLGGEVLRRYDVVRDKV